MSKQYDIEYINIYRAFRMTIFVTKCTFSQPTVNLNSYLNPSETSYEYY
jgi:hypothetical protein